MSEKLGEVVNQDGKTAEQLRREADRDYETAANNYNNYVNDSVNNDLNKLNDISNRIERKPADSLGAQGYRPTSHSETTSNVPRNTVGNRPQSSLPSKPNQLANNNETAPDIGKDYGDSLPNPGENGYDKYGNVPQGEPVEPVDRNAQQAQQQAAQQAQQQAENDGSSKGSNDLEKAKEEKEKEEEEKKKAEEEEKKNQQENPNDPSKKSSDQQNEQAQNGYQPQQGQQQNQQGTATQKKPEGLDNQNNESQKKNSNDQVGNGYGALRRNKKNQPQASDATQNARKNLNHQNKVNKPRGLSNVGKGAGLGAGIMAGIGNRVRTGFKNIFNRAKNDFSDGNSGDDSEHDDSFLSNMMGKLFQSITSNPYVLIVIAVVLLFLLILLATLDGGGRRGSKTCTYTLSGLSSTGPVEIKDAKVEIINCDGSEKNGYEVLATVDFEKYILGVTLAEAGTGHPDDDTYKAQLIAVRNFTLTRHLGMCPSHPEQCFHGYNFETNTFRMRACTNDQVYWDYTQDCPAQDREGQPTLYCFGVDNPNKTWKTALSQEEIERYEAIAEEVMGEVLLDENGDVLKLGYKAPQTEQFISMGTEGYDYKEILGAVYGSDNVANQARCKYNRAFDYGDYTLTSDDDSVLNEPLDSFLSRNGTSLEEFNELIADNVDDAGYGTRQGVVAAAVTLIGELGDNYGVKVPYYWGGGHADGVVVGALGKWGSTECNTQANGRVYDRCGLDCSGFVPWAIKNGGFNMAQNLASNFQNIRDARRVSLNSSSAVLQPGDLLESDSHVVLVVGIDEENKQYICAEAAGYDYGVLFMRRPFGSDGYWGVDMEDYYNNESNVRESS